MSGGDESTYLNGIGGEDVVERARGDEDLYGVASPRGGVVDGESDAELRLEVEAL